MFQQVGQRALGTDAQKVEVSGGIEATVQHTISASREMMRDDPERMAGLLRGLADAGLLDLSQIHKELEAGATDQEDVEEDDIVDAEVVE